MTKPLVINGFETDQAELRYRFNEVLQAPAADNIKRGLALAGLHLLDMVEMYQEQERLRERDAML